MDVLGFIFGSSGFTFAIIGMIFGMNASSKVDAMELKLKEAGILQDQEAESESENE